MRAISLWQPWATLLVIGEKQFETRHWATNYHGPLLIHAASRQSEKRYMEMAVFREALASGGYDHWQDLAFGAIVGMVEMVDCRQMADLCDQWSPSEKEQAFGNWSPERFAWMMTHPQRFTHPVPFKGHQGFFDVPDSVWIVGAAVTRDSGSAATFR